MIFIPEGSVYADLHAEQKLADDLATVIENELGDEHPAVIAVLARYREARQ